MVGHSLGLVGVLRFLAVVAGFLALLTLPCWLLFLASADVVAERLERMVLRRMRGRRPRMPGRSWRDRRRFARLDRAMTRATAAEPSEPADPPIERIAADLRRLARQRLDIANRSQVWYAAVQRAYDDRLTVACRELLVEEHLAELSGVDLEIERVRVEGALQQAGLSVGHTGLERRQDQR
jgi:hypothetical protein